MKRRESLLKLLALGASGLPLAALAQKVQKQWRVGFFQSGTRSRAHVSEKAFLAGMKEHGYEIGRNLVVDIRYGEGSTARFAAIADELIALKPDVLVVSSTGNAIVLKGKTATIPIVLGTVADPVGAGLVQSLSRPGGNVTGNAMQLDELSAKQIDMMAEVMPRMRRVALLIDSLQAKGLNERVERLASAAASAKGALLEVHRVDNPDSLPGIFRKLLAARADLLVISPSPRLNDSRKRICESAAGVKLATIGFSEEWPEDGALMSFGPSWTEAYRRAAYFVDRILKGAKPADLPVEQPTKFDLVVNGRVAKGLGLSIPRSILLRADRVIE